MDGLIKDESREDEISVFFYNDALLLAIWRG